MTESLIGKTIERWRLHRFLGQGSFGAVYEARHTKIAGKKAAIKVLHRHRAANAALRQRFFNEATAASSAEHQNIIDIYDADTTEDGLCFVIMEYLEGRTLSDAVREAPLDLPRLRHIGLQIALALEKAHSLKIVHRDLKPANIFLSVKGTAPDFVKVLDFGIAKLREDLGGGGTREGEWIGSPDYMSPEQWQTFPDIDGRADIYSLGIIFFECLTGRTPFQGASHYEWQQAHLHQPVPDLRRFEVTHPGLVELVTRMLAKERDARPQSMHEVASALYALQALKADPSSPTIHERAVVIPASPRQDVESREPDPSPPRPQGESHPTGAGEVAASSPPPPSRRGPGIWLAAVVTAALAGGGTFAALRLRHGPGDRHDAGMWLVRDAAAGAASRVVLDLAPPPDLTVRIPDGMVRIPAGSFRDAEGREVSVHAFAIERTEVMVGAYWDFADTGQDDSQWSRRYRRCECPGFASTPATIVTQQQAARYCRWKYGTPGRLPRAEEWEWAARGPGGNLYPWGSSFDPRCVNALPGKKDGLEPPGKFPCGSTPETGIVDMAGNAREWTATESAAGSSPRGWVVKGGSYKAKRPEALTVTAREVASQEDNLTGFRCIVELEN